MCNAVTKPFVTRYEHGCNALPDPTRPEPNYLTTRVETFHHDVTYVTRAVRDGMMQPVDAYLTILAGEVRRARAAAASFDATADPRDVVA